jgi:hypothetical protein
MRRRPLLAALAALGAGLSAAPAEGALRWRACTGTAPRNFECARLRVPRWSTTTIR